MKKLLLLLNLSFFIALSLHGQKRSFTVKYTEEPIKMDAVLDEPAWQTAGMADDFWQYFPTDSIKSETKAEIRMLFDDKNLYVGITVYAIGPDFIVPSLKRDFRARGNDNISMYFDTFNDGTNAYFFGTNPLGVRRESLISGGGAGIDGFDISWDTKWDGRSRIDGDKYISEWVIPLSAFKYKEGETKWGFNSYLFDTQNNERTSWVNIPRNQIIFNLGFLGEMHFDRPLGKSKAPISLIPYVNTGYLKDYEGDKDDAVLKVGGDAKMTIGNSMNLDLTLNPDFSQVEVDDIVTNLSRFSVALPEKRQFFIENSDLFGGFGDNRESRTFFSRRIGIATDTLGRTIENRILGGARLSGKLNSNLRLGLLNMQTESDGANRIAGANNTVIALQQKVLSRSNISLLLMNKQVTGEYDFLTEDQKYNRVIGLDYNMASADNTWTGKYYFHKSFSPEDSGDGISTGATTNYNSRNYQFRLGGLYIDDDFRSDLGFIRRKGIVKLNTEVQRNFWPSGGMFNKHSLTITPVAVWSPEDKFRKTDHFIRARWSSDFNNQNRISLNMENRYVYLYYGFDPTRSGGTPLPSNQGYNFTNVSFRFSTDQRKPFSAELEPGYGSFYNGEKYSFRGTFRYRLQPYFFASAQVNYDRIDLAEGFPSADLWLIGPKLELTFSKSLFWTTLIQYSNFSDNLGFNSRLQWRFKPLSDIYLVYTDNYMTSDFMVRNRSITLKATYWLNI